MFRRRHPQAQAEVSNPRPWEKKKEKEKERMKVMKKRGLSVALLGVFLAFQALTFSQPSHAMTSGCVPPSNPVGLFRIMVVGYEYVKGDISIKEAFFKIFSSYAPYVY